MAGNHHEDLEKFSAEKAIRGQGALSIMLLVTQHAKKLGLPLDPEKLVTKVGTQVLGAGGDAVQAILKRHGITRTLAAEGGRTSRGSVIKMRDYVAFLNDLKNKGAVNLDAVEEFWIGRVHAFFAGKPFKIKLDGSRSLRTVVRDVLAQAIDRQKTAPGVHYAGAVLQHLVGAKLECALGKGTVGHNSFSTADAPGGRAGDFF